MSLKLLFCTSVFREDVNSAGRHMIDLVREFDARGFDCEVVTNIYHERSDLQNTKVRSIDLELRGRKKSIRLFCEIFTPIAFFLKDLMRTTPKYDATICYSPSIFWYLYVKLLGQSITGKKILILRDIFPLWLVDVGLLTKKGVAFRVLNYFCYKQLLSYDVILVQNQHDIELLEQNYPLNCNVDILNNWYSKSPVLYVSKDVTDFCKPEAFTLGVLGNFGPAQDLESSCLALSAIMKKFQDVRLLFIGQGDEARNYFSENMDVGNGRVKFENTMSHDQAINTLSHVDAGFFSLHEANKQGHFPGKVLAYMMAGLPVIGQAGIDAPISKMLRDTGFGMVFQGESRDKILRTFEDFKSQNWPNQTIKQQAQELYSSNYAFKKISRHIENV